MSTAVWMDGVRPNSVADTALKAATRFWFFVAVIGQWAFLYAAFNWRPLLGKLS